MLSYGQGKFCLIFNEEGEVMATTILGTSTVAEDGNIPFPQKLKDALSRNGLGSGVDVTIVFDGKRVVLMDSALYALQEIGEAMEGKAAEAGFSSEEELDDYVLRTPRRS